MGQCQARADLALVGGPQIFDGHNGHQASLYSKENLLTFVLNAIPSGLDRDDWLASLPRALVIGFLKADTEFNLVGEGRQPRCPQAIFRYVCARHTSSSLAFGVSLLPLPFFLWLHTWMLSIHAKA